jgi:hypothetical protein
MKLFLAFGLALAGASGATHAMLAAPAHGGGLVNSGAITRTTALGGPAAANGARTYPLGGVSSAGPRNFRGIGRPPAPRVYPYGYSWYVPNYYNWGDDSYYSAPTPPPAPDAAAAPQQPVIINQYFGAQDRSEEPAPQAAPNDPPQAAGDPIGIPQNYYLIAYRNHAVYSALAYWVEDKTLHYVTTQNTHNQASLDLIDLDLTKSLNQTRDVPFSIPGH